MIALYSLCESLPTVHASAPTRSTSPATPPSDLDPDLDPGDTAARTLYPVPTHVHLWTDNTSALSWMTRHKAHHPLHAFVLHLYAYLQVRYSVVVTAGHIPGLQNRLGDDPSRGFSGPNGALTQALLSGVARTLALPPWLASLRATGRASSSTTWEGAVSALTPLV